MSEKNTAAANDSATSALIQEAILTQKLSPAFVAALPEPLLLFFMPLILNAILDASELSPLLKPLRCRICSSRRVKLRFMLLRKHPAFLCLPTKLSYSSHAYGPPSVIGCRIIAKSRSEFLGERPKRVVLKVPVDMVDLQSEDFFRSWVFLPEADHQESLGMQLLCHPFPMEQVQEEQLPDDLSFASDDDSSFENEDDVFQTARFLHLHGQRTVELMRIKPGEEEVTPENLEVLLPKILIKEGHDVLKLQATQVFFYLLSHVWSTAWAQHEDAESAPLCVSFDAVATHEGKGLLQAFGKLQTFSSFNFDFWQHTRAHDPVVVDHFLRSAAGALTAGYIAGINYKTGEEIMVRNGEAIFLCEAEGIFQTTGPRMTVPKSMRESFQQLQVWDEFRSCCIRAFEVARAAHDDIFPMVIGLYKRCGMNEAKVTSFLQGRSSLNLLEQDHVMADADFRKWLG